MGSHLSSPEDFHLADFLNSDGVATRTNSHFVRWDIPNVRAAWQRVLKAKKVGPKIGVTDYLITEADFRETFQEQSVIYNGAFLSLPLSVFHDFVTKSSDHKPSPSPTVFLPNLMSTLILFCEGTFQEKMAFLFDLADLNRVGNITLTELMFLLCTCTQMMKNLGLCKGAPSQIEALELSQDCFDGEDVSHNDRISLTQFHNWVLGSKKLAGTLRRHVVIDLSTPVITHRRMNTSKRRGSTKNDMFRDLISSPGMSNSRDLGFRAFTDRMQSQSQTEFKRLQASGELKGSTPALRSKRLAQAKLQRIMSSSHKQTKQVETFVVDKSKATSKKAVANFALNALSKLNLNFAKIGSTAAKTAEAAQAKGDTISTKAVNPEEAENKPSRKESRLAASEKLSKLASLAAARRTPPPIREHLNKVQQGDTSMGDSMGDSLVDSPYETSPSKSSGADKKTKKTASVSIQLRQLGAPTLSALEDFRDATGGFCHVKWRNNTGWSDILHEDEIFGVDFDEGPAAGAGEKQVLVVVGLAMRQNNLQGPLPLSISALSSLQELKLKDNQLSGAIPWASLGSLTALKELDISMNAFDPAPIDGAVGNMRSLKRLALASTNATGTLPEEMQQLVSLETLDLSGNQLNGSLPEWIGELSGLADLLLQQNQFSGAITARISQLESLNTLRLNHNHLSGALPEELGELVDLEELHLNHNRFESIPEGLFREMSALEELKLESNCLTGFPSFMLPLSKANEDCECSIGENQWDLASSNARISASDAVEMDGAPAGELWGALAERGGS
jgi:Leucine-rich repeat (LRR) protein